MNANNKNKKPHRLFISRDSGFPFCDLWMNKPKKTDLGNYQVGCPNHIGTLLDDRAKKFLGFTPNPGKCYEILIGEIKECEDEDNG